MYRIFLQRLGLLFWISAVLSACVMRPPPLSEPTAQPTRGAQLQGHLVAVRTKHIISLDAFIEATARHKVIAVGEEHDHPAIQAFELQLLQALAQRHPHRLALAMEFLERDMQPFINAYLAGTSDAATLQHHLNATPYFVQYYFPLLHYARQEGLPVLAINIPRRLAQQIAHAGLPALLASTDQESRAYLPSTLGPITAPYRTYFHQAITSVHPLPAKQTEWFLEAAHVKDETMADTLSTFLAQSPQAIILAIAGRFHVDYGLAIPTRLRQRAPTASLRRLTTMSVDADEAIDLRQLAQTDLTDYLWFAPPHPARQSSQ